MNFQLKNLAERIIVKLLYKLLCFNFFYNFERVIIKFNLLYEKIIISICTSVTQYGWQSTIS